MQQRRGEGDLKSESGEWSVCVELSLSLSLARPSGDPQKVSLGSLGHEEEELLSLGFLSGVGL